MSNTSTRTYKVYSRRHEGAKQKHPMIRIGGEHLKLFDFAIGDTISVSFDKGQLIITKSNEEKKSKA